MSNIFSKELEKDINYGDYKNFININSIEQIKSSLVLNSNKIFICFNGFSSVEKDYVTNCYIYVFENNKIPKAFYYSYLYCFNFEVYYFEETKDYILICNNNINIIRILQINENNLGNYREKFSSISFDDCDYIYNFTLFYNSFNEEYCLISDCIKYNNGKDNWSLMYNGSFFSPLSTILSTIPSIIPSNILSTFPSNIISNIPTTIHFNIPSIITYIDSSLSSFINPSLIESSILSSTSLKIFSSIISSEDTSFQSNIISFNTQKNSAISVIIKEKEIEKNFNGGKEELLGNLTDLLNNITIGLKYKIIGEDFILTIRPTNSSFLEESTHVNFSNCENTLRKELNISNSRIITFLQLEIENKNDKSLVNNVEYQAYDDNKKILDLSLCNESNILIFYVIKNNTLDKNYISSFKDLDIDILNINDTFFNDICHTFSDSKNDIVLEDRIKDIYQNFSLCDKGCSYNEINTTYMTISCECKVKTNISIKESSINLAKFDEMNIDSNFELIKCYNLVFSFNGKKNNIGFWIFLILVMTLIPIFIIFCGKGFNSIKNFLINEMIKYGYLKKSNINNPVKKNKKSKKESKKEKIFNNSKLNGNYSSINKMDPSEREIISNLNSNNNYSKKDNKI